VAAPSWAEFFDDGATEATTRRPDLAIREGDISEMLIAGAASMADRVAAYASERFAVTYLDGAKGSDLTTLADDHWGIQRQAANPAAGSVTFTRSGATANPVSWPIGTIVATVRDAQGNEVRFLTLQAANWAASVNGAVSVNVEAETGGTDGNVLAGTVTRIISTSPGEGTYTLNNAALFAGGTEEENDESLRARVRSFPATLRRATLDALEYGALQVPGVAKASAIEADDGAVTVYVTDASGASTGTTVLSSASTTDDGSMTHDVAIELHGWRAAGSFVVVTGGQLQTVDIEVALTVRIGVDVAQLALQVEAAIDGAVSRLKIGETLYKSLIQAAARSVDPDNILEVEVVSPVTNTAPTDGSYIIRAGTITVG
jgi:uncharacterized phage protein gp47/JayE